MKRMVRSFLSKPVNAMLFTMLVWGIGPVFIRSLSIDLGAADALVIRYTLVSFGYGIGLYLVGKTRIERKDWPRILFISIIGILGYNLGSVFGFELVPAGIGGIIIGTQPLLIVLLAALVSRTIPSPAAFAGLALAFAGTALLFWKDLTVQGDNGNLALGAVFIFLSGFAWAIYVVLAKPLIIKYGTYQITALTILIATVPMLAFASSTTYETLREMTLRNWAEMLYLVVIAGLIGAVTWNFAAARLSSVATGAFLYLVPIIAIVAGALILDETVTASMLLGGLLVLLGVAIAQFSDRLTSMASWALPILRSPVIRAYGALLLAVTVWGLVPVAIRFLVMDLRPETLLVIRLFPTGFLAVTVLLIRGMNPIAKEDWARILIASLLGNCGYQVLAHFGLNTVPASWTGMIFGLEPLFVALFAILLSGERLTGQLITGMAVSMAGVGVLTLGSASSFDSDVGLPGLFLVVLSTMGWGIYTVVIRPVAQKYGSFEMSCLTLAISALPMVLFVRPGIEGEVASLAPLQWSALGFLIVFGTFLAVILWNYGISRIESSTAGMSLYVQPVVAALGGVLLLGENVTWPLVVGGAIIVTGVAASQWQQAPPEVVDVPPSPEPQRIRSAVERLVASAKEAQRSK
jgi:drug/metabolite transporter (DMT)-like permease